MASNYLYTNFGVNSMTVSEKKHIPAELKAAKFLSVSFWRQTRNRLGRLTINAITENLDDRKK